jgi:formate hydrogenlyase subunit 4
VTAQTVASGVVQVAGAVLAPLLPGVVQAGKARLQGRRGPGVGQPYRELRRLWGKGSVQPAGATAVYRLAPPVAAASLLALLLVVPVSAAAPDWGVGRDALLVAGLLALARLCVCLAAWDCANGFALQGASRDLTVAVFVEIVLLLSLAGVAVSAGTTDLPGMVAATAGTGPWSSPALPLAALAFAFVVVAEVGRQPFDNPDTHLELTMIHEGPLLEYAGRDLAYLQWAAAARHWVVAVLAVALFLPHPADPWAQLALLPLGLAAVCLLLAAVETLVVKMRILLAPRALGVAAAVAVLGLAAQLAGVGG